MSVFYTIVDGKGVNACVWKETVSSMCSEDLQLLSNPFPGYINTGVYYVFPIIIRYVGNALSWS